MQQKDSKKSNENKDLDKELKTDSLYTLLNSALLSPGNNYEVVSEAWNKLIGMED